MDSSQKDRDARPFDLWTAIPRQRRSADHEAILADDRLIEDIRFGRVTDLGAEPPLVRMLVRWRDRAVAGT